MLLYADLFTWMCCFVMFPAESEESWCSFNVVMDMLRLCECCVNLRFILPGDSMHWIFSSIHGMHDRNMVIHHTYNLWIAYYSPEMPVCLILTTVNTEILDTFNKTGIHLRCTFSRESAGKLDFHSHSLIGALHYICCHHRFTAMFLCCATSIFLLQKKLLQIIFWNHQINHLFTLYSSSSCSHLEWRPISFMFVEVSLILISTCLQCAHVLIMLGCGVDNEIKPREPIRCKDCGHRILYKKRTKRMIQFEAR